MKYKTKLNQSGLVSIVSTILIILIITVITLSLSALSRRNLRQALDEQLSTQALYAAESGINDALKKINSITGDIATCSVSQINFSTPVSLDPTSNIRYTCVLVDKTPPQINTDVSQYTVKSYPIIAESGLVSQLTFTWKSTNTNATPTFENCTSNCFKPSNAWALDNKLGVLRIRLLPVDSSLTRGSIGNTIDVVAYPGSINGESDSFTASNTSRQKLMSSNCVSNACSITISGLNSSGLPGKYYVQLYSYYDDINVTISGNNSNNNPINFTNAQATIDSTGAATDVLKRLKVTIPLPKVSGLPPYVLSVGDDLCKRFTTNATSTEESAADAEECTSF